VETRKFYRVIACEIAFRELSICAARSPSLLEFDFVTQGHHDTPALGRVDLQKRIDAVPEGKYDAILLGYGLCSNILAGLRTAHTPLVVPRAHDCITLFLGSKERYQREFSDHPGTYYYTSGWLECAQRRGLKEILWGGASQFGTSDPTANPSYQKWVEKYGEDQARFLVEEMGRWANAYSHGTLIQFDFARGLGLEKEVGNICASKEWQYGELEGDLSLLQRFVDGQWAEGDFLVVPAGGAIAASFDDKIVKVSKDQ
jgi:hypothetical protein